jgi:hypothetical protein
MEKARSRKIKSIVLLVSLAAIALALLLLNIILSPKYIDRREIDASIIVAGFYGLDINGTALKFGALEPYGSSSRELIIDNQYNKDILVKIHSKGSISQFLSTPENVVSIKQGEKKFIPFSVNIPEGTPYGNYTGKVVLYIY